MGRSNSRKGSTSGERRRIRDGWTKPRTPEPKALTGQTTAAQAAYLERCGVAVPKQKHQAALVIDHLKRLNGKPDQNAHDLARWYLDGGEKKVNGARTPQKRRKGKRRGNQRHGKKASRN